MAINLAIHYDKTRKDAVSRVGHMLFVPDISLWQWLTDLVIVAALLDAECRATIKLFPNFLLSTPIKQQR